MSRTHKHGMYKMPRMTVANRMLCEQEQHARHDVIAGRMKRDFTENVFRYDTARTFCLLGMKGSGKTHATLAWIYDALLLGTYKEIFAIIPCYEIEQHRSYEWLGQFKNVYVFTEFEEAIIKMVMDRATDDPTERRMLWLDDATEFIDVLNKSEHILNCFVTSRHVGVDMVIGAHAALKLFSPAMRANCDRILLFRFANAKVLETIFEEWFSLSGQFPDKKDFEAFFRRYVINDEYKTGHEAIVYDGLQRDVEEAWSWASALSMIDQFNAALADKSNARAVPKKYAKVCGTDEIDLAWDKTKHKKVRKAVLKISDKGDYSMTGISVDNPHYKPKPGSSKDEPTVQKVGAREAVGVGATKRVQGIGKQHRSFDGTAKLKNVHDPSKLYMLGPGYTFMQRLERNMPELFHRPVWERADLHDEDDPRHLVDGL